MILSERNFSYDVTLIADRGLNQMRFELGDIFVEEPDKTAYLADEEIQAMLEAFPKKWKRAKFELVKSLLYRFAPEVDTQSGPVRWALSQRYSQWKALYQDLKSEASASGTLPIVTSIYGRNRPPYFYEGLHDNKTSLGGRHVFTTR